jgi:hypothetical protein
VGTGNMVVRRNWLRIGRGFWLIFRHASLERFSLLQS